MAVAISRMTIAKKQKNKACSGKVRALLADRLARLPRMRRESFALRDQKLPPVKDTSSRVSQKAPDQNDRRHHHQVIKKQVRLGAAGWR